MAKKTSKKTEDAKAEANEAALALKRDRDIAESDAPMTAEEAKTEIATMDEGELDTFEIEHRTLVRHTPGILGAIQARRSELK